MSARCRTLSDCSPAVPLHLLSAADSNQGAIFALCALGHSQRTGAAPGHRVTSRSTASRAFRAVQKPLFQQPRRAGSWKLEPRRYIDFHQKQDFPLGRGSCTRWWSGRPRRGSGRTRSKTDCGPRSRVEAELPRVVKGPARACPLANQRGSSASQRTEFYAAFSNLACVVTTLSDLACHRMHPGPTSRRPRACHPVQR